MASNQEIARERAQELYEKGHELGEANDIYSESGIANIRQFVIDSSIKIAERPYESTTLLGVKLGEHEDSSTIYLQGNHTVIKDRLRLATVLGHHNLHYQEHMFDHMDYYRMLKQNAPGAVCEIRFSDEMGLITQEARFYAAGLLLGRFGVNTPTDRIGQGYEVPQSWAESHLAFLGKTGLAEVVRS